MTTSTNKNPYANMVLMHDLRAELEAQRKYTHGLEASESALLAHVAHLKTELATLRAAAEIACDQLVRSMGAGWDTELRAALAQTAPHENPYAELVEAAQRARDVMYKAGYREETLGSLDAALAKVAQ
jgi:hypothetical protein